MRKGVVAVIACENRFLAITRSETVPAPGKICFPGGGIEPGETTEQALIRECREELGIDVEPLRQIAVSITPWSVRLHWWTASLSDRAASFSPDRNEVASIQWMTPDEMLEHPDLLESNRSMIEKLKEMYEK